MTDSPDLGVFDDGFRWKAVYRIVPDEQPQIEEALKSMVRFIFYHGSPILWETVPSASYRANCFFCLHILLSSLALPNTTPALLLSQVFLRVAVLTLYNFHWLGHCSRSGKQ